MNAKTLISIADLAREYGLDISYLAKLIKNLKINTIPSVNKEGYACKAISNKDVEKLEKSQPSLKAVDFNAEKHITIAQMAEELGRDSSGLHKAIRNAEFEFIYCRVPTERTRTIKREGEKAVKEKVICSGKATPCLTKTEFEKFKAKRNRIQLG